MEDAQEKYIEALEEYGETLRHAQRVYDDWGALWKWWTITWVIYTCILLVPLCYSIYRLVTN
jgi:hypothetical protein